MSNEKARQDIELNLKLMCHITAPNLPNKGRDMLQKYRQTLRVQGSFNTWEDWVARAQPRDGYPILKRFEGWASDSPFPPVPFALLEQNGSDTVMKDSLVVVHSLDGMLANCSIYRSGHVLLNERVHVSYLVPIFISKLGGSTKAAHSMSEHVKSVRRGVLTLKETRDDLDVTKGYKTTMNGYFVADTKSKTKETETMKNTKTDNFIQDQKAIAKEIASLNAGRVSNKVVKEAMRPVVALLFKPTFMQKLAMKITGAKNPLDEFMNTPYADLICAQLFKTVIDMREVDNEHVKKTANSAVIYAGLKVTEELPIEDLIDKAIKQVTEATTNAIGKGE